MRLFRNKLVITIFDIHSLLLCSSVIGEKKTQLEVFFLGWPQVSTVRGDRLKSTLATLTSIIFISGYEVCTGFVTNTKRVMNNIMLSNDACTITLEHWTYFNNLKHFKIQIYYTMYKLCRNLRNARSSL